MKKPRILMLVCVLVVVGSFVGCTPTHPCVIPEQDKEDPDIGLEVLVGSESWEAGDENTLIDGEAGVEYNVVAVANDPGCLQSLEIHVEGAEFRETAALQVKGNRSTPTDQLLASGTLEPARPGVFTLWAVATDYAGNESRTARMSFAIPGIPTSLSGDTSCVWGATNCNPCVRNVSTELDRIQNDYQSAGRIRFAGYAYPTPGYILHRISGTYEHVQSIGRIAGVGNNEFMVFTHSTCSDESNRQGALAVVRMGARQDTGGGAFYGMPNGDGSNQNTGNRTVARTYAGNNHPGGLSVLGHYVYVAQYCQDHGADDWCPPSSPAVHGHGFSVYDAGTVNMNASINSNPPIHRHYHHVHEEDWIRENGDRLDTATVAAVKLSSSQYLVALGLYGGEKYGFYTAPSPTGPFTFHNSSKIERWAQTANIVTECSTGDLFMFQIEGSGSSHDVDEVHLYKLVLNNGAIGFQYVKSRTFHCRGSNVDGDSDWCHFDAGTGIYVTPAGSLILYATDWHQDDGNIRLVEFY